MEGSINKPWAAEQRGIGEWVFVDAGAQGGDAALKKVRLEVVGGINPGFGIRGWGSGAFGVGGPRMARNLGWLRRWRWGLEAFAGGGRWRAGRGQRAGGRAAGPDPGDEGEQERDADERFGFCA